MCARNPLYISPYNERYLFKNQSPNDKFFYINAVGIVYPDRKYKATHHFGHYTFEYVLAGEGHVFYNGKSIPVCAGDLIYMGAEKGISYDTSPDAPYTKMWFNGAGKFFDTMEKLFFSGEALKIMSIPNGRKTSSAFHSCFDAVKSGVCDTDELMCLVMKLYKNMAMAASENAPQSTENISSDTDTHAADEMRRYIDIHLFDGKNLHDIAARFGITERTFHTHFKKAFGVPPHTYILDTKLESARIMLHRPEISVSEVAEKTGFCSASYFNGRFKKKYGITPMQYKKKLKTGAESNEKTYP